MARAILRFEWADEEGARRIVAALQARAREHGVYLELVTLTGHGDAGKPPAGEPLDKATAVWDSST